MCGVATADIAHAFLVPEPTMAARITRAKKKIAAARIPYAVPAADELPARVSVVLTVVHLLHSAGHTAPSGADLVRDDLAGRALDLARMLRLLLPADTGRLLRLEDQDRSRWDTALIAEADRLVVEALQGGPPGRFAVQAAIAALHAQAPSYAETDWPQILTLYDVLLRLWPSPVVALNRAVALSMVDGPEAALTEIARLEDDGRLAGYRYLPAAKADLLHRLGRDTEAAEAYRAALALRGNAVEEEFLAERLNAADSGPVTTGAARPPGVL